MAYDLETCIIGGLGPIKFVHMMAMVDLDLFYGKVKIMSLRLLYREKVKLDFSGPSCSKRR